MSRCPWGTRDRAVTYATGQMLGGGGHQSGWEKPGLLACSFLCPRKCFVSPGLFFSCSLLVCLFQWRLLPFLEWPGSPFQICWQELGIELEPDFHKLIWSQFPVCSQHCSKPAAQPHTLLELLEPTHLLGSCVSVRVLPCPLPGSSSANWNSLLKFLLCYQPFKPLF